METALKVLKTGQIEGGKQKTFVKIVEGLLPQIGLTANVVEDLKNIDDLYTAGLLAQGDTAWISYLFAFAEKSGLAWVTTHNGHHNDIIPKKFDGDSGYGMQLLSFYNTEIPPPHIISYLSKLSRKAQKSVYIRDEEKDPVVFFKIPTKLNYPTTYYIEVMRWG